MHSVKWANLVETLESFMHCIAVSLRPLLSFSPALSFYPSFVACLRIFGVDWRFSSCLLFWFVDLLFSPKISIIQAKRTTVGFLLPPAFLLGFFWEKKEAFCQSRVLGPRRHPLKQQELCAFHIAVQCKENPVGFVIAGYLWIYPGFWLLMAVRWLWNFYMCSERFWKGSLLITQDSLSCPTAHRLLGSSIFSSSSPASSKLFRLLLPFILSANFNLGFSPGLYHRWTTWPLWGPVGSKSCKASLALHGIIRLDGELGACKWASLFPS